MEIVGILEKRGETACLCRAFGTHVHPDCYGISGHGSGTAGPEA